MDQIVIGRRYASPSCYRKAVVYRATILAAAASLLVGISAHPVRADVLRWKFKVGEVLHYSIEQKTQMSAKGMEQDRKSGRLQTLDISWTINSVGAGGEADVTLRYDRVRMRSEMPPLMPFEFDSRDAKAAAPSGFEAEVQQLKAIVGAEVSFKIRPSGQLEDVKLPEQTLKQLRDCGPQGRHGRGRGVREIPQGDAPPVEPSRFPRRRHRGRQDLVEQAG